MSLSLLQGYSSDEEAAVEGDEFQYHITADDDDDGDDDDDDELPSLPSATSVNLSIRDASLFEIPHRSSAHGLPSAFDAFSEISGPPEFLNNCVEDFTPAKESDLPRESHGTRRKKREKKELPPGALVEAKAHLVGIHDRVRSDMEGNQTLASSASSMKQGNKRVPTAANPNPDDAAELLRMCLQCGVPKTFSSSRGMFCPVCSDRPLTDPSQESKKKGSTVKEKEKSKRMRGQSSHATWKSETEMQLRQQFD